MRHGVFLNAGFGELLQPERFDRIAEAGFSGIRFDCLYFGPHGQPPRLVPMDVIEQTVRALSDRGMKMQALLSRPLKTGFPDIGEARARIADMGSLVDVIHSWHPELEANDGGAFFAPIQMRDYTSAVAEAVDLVSVDHPPLVTCGVTNNTSRKALDYYRQVFAAGPVFCDALGLHPYRTDAPVGQVVRGHGWKNREEEWRAWREFSFSVGKPIWLTEYGEHNGVSWVPASALYARFGIRNKRIQWTEQEVAERTIGEVQAWVEKCGAECVSLFQEMDASADEQSHEGHYGLWRLDGSPKPLAGRIREIARLA